MTCVVYITRNVQLGGKFTDWMIEVGYIGFFWRTYCKEHTLRQQRTGTLLFVVWMLLCSVYTWVLTDFCDTNQEDLSNEGKNPGLWLDIAIGIHWSSQSWYISLSDPQGKESWQGVRKLANPQLWGHYNSQHSLLFKWWGAEDPLVACQSLMLTLLVSMCNNTMPFVFRDSVLLHLWILQYGVLEFQAIYWVYRSPLMWYSTILYRG